MNFKKNFYDSLTIKKTQNLLFEVRDTNCIFSAGVILLIAVTYLICLMLLMELNTNAWFIFGNVTLEAISAKVLLLRIYWEEMLVLFSHYYQ